MPAHEAAQEAVLELLGAPTLRQRVAAAREQLLAQRGHREDVEECPVGVERERLDALGPARRLHERRSASPARPRRSSTRPRSTRPPPRLPPPRRRPPPRPPPGRTPCGRSAWLHSFHCRWAPRYPRPFRASGAGYTATRRPHPNASAGLYNEPRVSDTSLGADSHRRPRSAAGPSAHRDPGVPSTWRCRDRPSAGRRAATPVRCRRRLTRPPGRGPRRPRGRAGRRTGARSRGTGGSAPTLRRVPPPGWS